MPSSRHEYGLNCLSEFQLPSRGDPTSGTQILQVQQRWLLLVLASPSKRGPGSEQRDVGLCCRKQVGFQAGGNPAWWGLLALATYVLGP